MKVIKEGEQSRTASISNRNPELWQTCERAEGYDFFRFCTTSLWRDASSSAEWWWGQLGLLAAAAHAASLMNWVIWNGQHKGEREECLRTGMEVLNEELLISAHYAANLLIYYSKLSTTSTAQVISGIFIHIWCAKVWTIILHVNILKICLHRLSRKGKGH